MAKLEQYKGSVELLAGITQKGGGDFALIDANAVQTDENGTRLDEELEYIRYRLEGTITDETGTVIAVDDILSTASKNPVQNKVITTKINEIENTYATKKELAEITVSGGGVIVDNVLDGKSENPVQNKVITQEINTLSESHNRLADDFLLHATKYEGDIDLLGGAYNGITEQIQILNTSVAEVTEEFISHQRQCDAKVESIEGLLDQTRYDLSNKQDSLAFDVVPTEGSTAPVTSDGINQFVLNTVSGNITNILDRVHSDFYTKEQVNDLIDNIPTGGGTGGTITVDGRYNPDSLNAQSGLAVAEAIVSIYGSVDFKNALDNAISEFSRTYDAYLANTLTSFEQQMSNTYTSKKYVDDAITEAIHDSWEVEV